MTENDKIIIDSLKSIQSYNEEILDMPVSRVSERIEKVSIEINKIIKFIEFNHRVLELKLKHEEKFSPRDLAKRFGVKWKEDEPQSEYFGIQYENKIEYFYKFKNLGLFQEICEGCTPAIADFDVSPIIKDILSNKVSIVKQPQKESKNE